MRLGMAMPLPLLADKCECKCGKMINRKGYHLLTCKVGGGPVWSHNCMVSVWADCLSQLHVPYYIEPKDRYTTSSGNSFKRLFLSCLMMRTVIECIQFYNTLETTFISSVTTM